MYFHRDDVFIRHETFIPHFRESNMRIRFLPLIILALLPASILAQSRDSVGMRVRHVTYDSLHPKAYFSMRAGLWFGGDMGTDFSSNEGVTPGSIQSKRTISYSRGWGVDLHFAGHLSQDFYWDLALGGWYTSVDTTYDPAYMRIKSSHVWGLIIPFTLGGSYYFPTQIAIKPYLQAGLGAVAGYTARTEPVTDGTFENLHWQDQKTQVILGGYLGAGSKLAMTKTFGLDLSLKYMLGSFSEQLHTGVKSLSGIQVTLGIGLIIPYQK